MTKRLPCLLATLLALGTATAHASTLKDVESSAIVEGTIVLAPDGHVQDVVVPKPEKYGQPIVDMLRATAFKWRFEPVVVNGQPAAVKSAMHARVVLKKTAGGTYEAWVKGATFGTNDPNDTGAVRGSAENKHRLPRYPRDAIVSRTQGTVYLALRVDRDGRVADAVAEQVNLYNVGPEALLQRVRHALAESALKAAKTWTYVIPTTGPLAKRDQWDVRVPITYTLMGGGAPSNDGTWVVYTPGPYTPAPWVTKPDANAADALADDSVQTEGAGPKLLTATHQG